MKIIRYHDYGMALDSMPDENGIVSDNFYFSLFELDNGNILCIHTYKSFNNKTKTFEWNEFGSVDKDGNDILVGPYSIYYSQDYIFGEDFFAWFDRSLNTKHNYDELKWPTQQEKDLVTNFYEKNIKPLYN
tara:strand:+ start:163 stop:555 length:393 start_codon:yes stop_codon:yes gene_type:complete